MLQQSVLDLLAMALNLEPADSFEQSDLRNRPDLIWA